MSILLLWSQFTDHCDINRVGWVHNQWYSRHTQLQCGGAICRPWCRSYIPFSSFNITLPWEISSSPSVFELFKPLGILFTEGSLRPACRCSWVMFFLHLFFLSVSRCWYWCTQGTTNLDAWLLGKLLQLVCSQSGLFLPRSTLSCLKMVRANIDIFVIMCRANANYGKHSACKVGWSVDSCDKRWQLVCPIWAYSAHYQEWSWGSHSEYKHWGRRVTLVSCQKLNCRRLLI